ncbi:ParB/RepB/Spo0J family partition protein [Streptomyces longwoodensis]|uniref:ParB/RepB/Spo0J family partition protein n=1 Tax=Streptomyces longwoodensis TaxID=68231 RepID=UPI0033D11EBB
MSKSPKGRPAGTPAAAPESSKPQFFELATEDDGDALTVAVDDITPNPFNDRDLGDITQLAESIDRDGLLQDIVVMHTSAFAEFHPEQAASITTKYVLAFGERRWRAHMHLGRDTISAILRNDTAGKIRRVLFTENHHRKQLSPIEEARNFWVLKNEFGLSHREIVKECLLNHPNHVTRRLQLLELPPALQEIVATEEGPGVTMARNIGQQLAEPDEQLRAWELIRDEGLNLKQAVDRIRNADLESPRSAPAAEPSGEQESVPQGNTTRPAELKQSAVPQGNITAGADDGSPAVAKSQPTARKTVAAADRSAAERNNASADRDEACRQLIGNDTKLTAEQHDALFGRTLLAPMQQGAARSRAHRWLRDAGRAGFDIGDTDSYFEAVLSSGQADLVNRVAVATALAAGEVRARDGRRQWDKTDAEHVRLLIESTGYVPETAWERAQLDKFGVPYPGASAEPDPEPIH